VAPFGGVEARLGLLQGHQLRPLERPRVQVLVVRCSTWRRRPGSRRCASSRGDQGLLGLLDRRLPAAEIEQQVVQDDGRLVVVEWKVNCPPTAEPFTRLVDSWAKIVG